MWVQRRTETCMRASADRQGRWEKSILIEEGKRKKGGGGTNKGVPLQRKRRHDKVGELGFGTSKQPWQGADPRAKVEFAFFSKNQAFQREHIGRGTCRGREVQRGTWHRRRRSAGPNTIRTALLAKAGTLKCRRQLGTRARVHTRGRGRQRTPLYTRGVGLARSRPQLFSRPGGLMKSKGLHSHFFAVAAAAAAAAFFAAQAAARCCFLVGVSSAGVVGGVGRAGLWGGFLG